MADDLRSVVSNNTSPNSGFDIPKIIGAIIVIILLVGLVYYVVTSVDLSSFTSGETPVIDAPVSDAGVTVTAGESLDVEIQGSEAPLEDVTSRLPDSIKDRLGVSR